MEVGLPVGGALLSASVEVAFDRISKSSKFIKFFKGKKEIKFDEEVLDRLNITLYKIHDVLEDAEVKEGAKGVRTWLGKVRAEVNHAEDLLDEFNTECLRLQLHEQIQADLNSSLKSAYFKKLIQQLIKVTTTLEDFANQVQELGLRELDPKLNFSHREPSSSKVDNSLMIFGRDDEKNELIERVLCDGGASDVSVIAITGMGGVGKTTLAQLVYNDDRVKKKFQPRAWVCVSEEYDALKVTKALLMEVNSAVVDKEDSFNDLQVKLKDNLAGKCFLIILDDIWNENFNDWNMLKTPLNYGSRGSKILITTRNEKVASMMQNEDFHHLHPMPVDQSWCLFKSHAFDKGDHTFLEEVETIGKEIVTLCNGLPLAIKTIACILRHKRDIKEWRDILCSDVWAVDGDGLPALILRYKYLPSYLKSCFAFCALFHKDVPFDKDEVVLLWMANDLVKPPTQKVGREYFKQLEILSFFVSVNGKGYLMHDSINDLARYISGNTCIRLEDYQTANRHQTIQQENLLPPELLHLSYLTKSSTETSKKLRWLAQVQGLRTFLPIHQEQQWLYAFPFSFSDMFPGFQRLRALNLGRHDISMVPDSIGDLKHLRFLNLASTNIKKLPNAIGKCLNLQTLILTNCKELVELPEDMRLLINLQHLHVRGVGDLFIEKMATWLYIFKDIPNIAVVVDKIYGNVLEHLGKLQPCDSLNIIGLEDTDVVTTEGAKIEELKDESCIENLTLEGSHIIGLGDTDVVATEGAKREELKDQSCIESLTLEWSHNAECSEFKKFAKLEPHTNIKKLSIKGYTGSRFPDWLGVSSFSNMEFVSLKNCKNCLSLPPLGQLTGLKTLEISGMDGISEIGKEFYGDDSTSKPFQALEKLVFREMAE